MAIRYEVILRKMFQLVDKLMTISDSKPAKSNEFVYDILSKIDTILSDFYDSYETDSIGYMSRRLRITFLDKKEATDLERFFITETPYSKEYETEILTIDDSMDSSIDEPRYLLMIKKLKKLLH